MNSGLAFGSVVECPEHLSLIPSTKTEMDSFALINPVG
jgi:hypothetical protein